LRNFEFAGINRIWRYEYWRGGIWEAHMEPRHVIIKDQQRYGFLDGRILAGND
jgi:hypothetical protein